MFTIPSNIRAPQIPGGFGAASMGQAVSGGNADYFNKPLPVPSNDAEAMQALNDAKAAFSVSKVPAPQKAQAVHAMLDAYHKQAQTPLSQTLLQTIAREKDKHG